MNRRMMGVVALLILWCSPISSQSATPERQRGPIRPSPCITTITRAPDGLVDWSPNGQRYVTNKKDAAGTYQLYVGTRLNEPSVCITCTQQPNSPAPNKQKLQPHWHPSGEWIVLAGERDDYQPPFFSTTSMIEGWLQSGLWVNIYVTRPDGSEWHRLSDFGHQPGDGFTGVAFTPNGKQAVWAQIIDGNVFQYLFGRWQLILADFSTGPDGVPSLTNRRDITPAGAAWVETGNFAPDGRSLLITADTGLKDPQGMDQFSLDIVTGKSRNLTNSPKVWDEHGVFSPDGEKIFFMSSYPFRDNPLSSTVLFLKTEYMLMNSDGGRLEQLTHFNSPGYPESNPPQQGSVAANGVWRPDGAAITALNLFFPTYQTWSIAFSGRCRGGVRSAEKDFEVPNRR